MVLKEKTGKDNDSPFLSIMPLMESKSDLTDPEYFHQQVNITFHNMEAADYDKVHRDMWKSLLPQIKLLVNDAKSFWGTKMRLLDIGCGTGLSTELLILAAMKDHLAEITLLDTSGAMLEKAKKRAASWKIPATFFEGQIQQLEGEYDFVLVSSVLHHIPDLSTFLQQVISKMSPGGLLLTIHDPLHEAVMGEVYDSRCRLYEKYRQRRLIKFLARVVNGVRRRVTTRIDYITEANKLLLANKIIHTALTATEMWSITDIHVEGLPYASSEGISIEWLNKNTVGLRLIN